MDLSDKEIRLHCEAAALETLETMFFEIPDEPPAMANPAAGVMCVEAPFRGSVSGSLWVASSRAQFADLSEAFLGWESARPASGDRAALIAIELANMVTGSFVSRYRPDAHLTIEQPAVVALPAHTVGGWLSIPLAGGALWIRLALREG